ncbi:hypothetical protein [Streptomyces cadmiisoli]|uniref:MmyB family transcriptional regulator n=1 Tax=Streptomyces cadmiisoli TaxID=2184053 RepID=UPI003D7646DC
MCDLAQRREGFHRNGGRGHDLADLLSHHSPPQDGQRQRQPPQDPPSTPTERPPSREVPAGTESLDSAITDRRVESVAVARADRRVCCLPADGRRALSERLLAGGPRDRTRHTSGEFDHWWTTHRVASKAFGSKHVRHPVAGESRLHWQVLNIAQDPDQCLVILAPVDQDSRSRLACFPHAVSRLIRFVLSQVET